MDENPQAGNACGTGKTGCGLKCGCCTCRAIKGALLLLVGGGIGFFAGKRCGTMCATHDHAPAAVTTPAPAPAK